LRMASYATLITLAMFYGMAAYKFQLPPYDFVNAAFKHIGVRTPKEYLETPKDYLETDVAQLISIRQPQDVSRLRKELIAILWGNPGIPLSLPSAVDKGFTDTRYKDISSLSDIDKLSIVMEFGIESYLYHFIPKTPNNKVVLYHQGHEGDFYESKVQIRRFLNRGYSVAAFSMPLLGLNNQPTVQLPRQGKWKLPSHDHMKFLLPKNFMWSSILLNRWRSY